eukprot:GHVT01009646.1.p1 GENE.GHVT01009646.1~~GHVT01009646.1.p1  ORF type:complete len:135 (-),score=21.39 GHVT01009646.1:965-1369(-)
MLLCIGDTLFMAGCGRFFEGTADDMHHALSGVVARLPPETLVYPGHEYTIANMQFALFVERSNEALNSAFALASKRRQDGLPTVPSTIEQELATNPFIRVDQPSIRQSVHALASDSAGEVMAKLRQMKNENKHK